MSDKIKTEIEESVERESKGYAIEGEKRISCRYCNKNLVDIIIVKQTPNIHRFKANCPYCHGDSFTVKLSGKIYYQAYEPLTIEDLITDGDLTEFKLKL